MSFDGHLARLARTDFERFRIEVHRIHPEWFEPLEREIKLELGEMSEGADFVMWDVELGDQAFLHVSLRRDIGELWACFVEQYSGRSSLSLGDEEMDPDSGATLQSSVSTFLKFLGLPPMTASLSEDWVTLTLTEVDASGQEAQA